MRFLRGHKQRRRRADTTDQICFRSPLFPRSAMCSLWQHPFWKHVVTASRAHASHDAHTAQWHGYISYQRYKQSPKVLLYN